MDRKTAEAGSPSELHGGKGLAEIESYRPAGDSRLEQLGYKPELRRNLSLITVLGLSFSIIAAPFGLSTAASFSLLNGGTVTYFWGWLLLSLISLAMSASLSELASAYPTAGGVYHWAAYASPKPTRKLISFCTGWVSMLANITLALSIIFGEGQLILGAISLFRDQEWAPTGWQTILMFWAVMAFSLIVNIFGVRGNYLELLNTASMYWSAATVVIALVVLLVMSGDTKRSGYDAFLLFQNTADPAWTNGWAFFIGCLTPAYVMTGFATIAFLSEEVNNPERAVPRAMVGSVLAASACGFIWILGIIFTLPLDPSEILSASSGPLPALWAAVTGSAAGGFGILFLVIVIGLFASVGALTVALRGTWAFARDSGLPYSSVWAKVNKPLALPLNATLLTTFIISVLGLIYLGSTAAFSAFTSVATICLGISYAIPIGSSLVQRRVFVKDAPWSLGPVLGYIANIVTLVWVAFSVVLFSFPTTKTTDATAINYASVVFLGFAFFAAVYYVIWARRSYRGPLEVIEEDP